VIVDRPVLVDEATYGEPAGQVLVHYATSGPDATTLTFATQVAQVAEAALAHYLALGFRRPLSDGTDGGDGRIDIYLQDLQSADGNVTADSCNGGTCVGYAIAENDFVGYSYPTLTEAITSVIPHELFHLVQYAYTDDQPAVWSEGSAVWAVENFYRDANRDFERFLPGFVPKQFRPFERAAGGFGDSYIYGAGLWGHFLVLRHDESVMVAAWEQSATEQNLDAVAAALTERDDTLDAAWTDFTRANWFTGHRHAGGLYGPNALGWPQVSPEPLVDAAASVFVEGFSARYVPIRVSDAEQQITVTPPAGLRIAAWIVAADGAYASGIELAPQPTGLAAPTAPGDYTLVVTGLTRNTLPTEVAIALTALPEEPAPSVGDGTMDDESGGCAASRPRGALLLLLPLLRRRLRPRGRRGARPRSRRVRSRRRLPPA
jgi:hypothetical protein